MAIVGIIIGVLIALVIIIILSYLISIYNSFVRLKNNIEKAWSNIDVLLKQRHDELTKLMASVKAYANFEKSVLTDVTKARTAFLNAKTVPEKAKANNMMSSTLKSLFAVAENYPDLKANTNFIQFQKRVSDIENQISDRREFFNDSVNTYNIRREKIPDAIIANMLHYEKKELFKVDEADRKDVEVSF